VEAFLKCECPQCDQHIEYPAEAAGQIVACPNCSTPIELPMLDVKPPIIAPPKIGQDWRNDPATDKQKEKLSFFGYVFSKGITKGQASEAIAACVRANPEREREYQAVPATPEQIKRLEKLGLDTEDMGFYEARRTLDDPIVESNEFIAYMESEDGLIDEETDQINFLWADDYRKVGREEVARAWHHAKQKKGAAPETTEILDSLEELFSDFRLKPGKPGIMTEYCLYCRGEIEVELPQIEAGRKIKPEDLVSVPITCPHCGAATEVTSFRP
jgi:hypothetical protein